MKSYESERSHQGGEQIQGQVHQTGNWLLFKCITGLSNLHSGLKPENEEITETILYKMSSSEHQLTASHKKLIYKWQKQGYYPHSGIVEALGGHFINAT